MLRGDAMSHNLHPLEIFSSIAQESDRKTLFIQKNEASRQLAGKRVVVPYGPGEAHWDGVPEP